MKVAGLAYVLVFPVMMSAQQPRATALLPGYRTPVWLDTTGQVRRFAATPQQALDAVDSALRKVGVEVNARDPKAGLVGNGTLKTQRRFAGERISRWLDCGAGARGFNADVYRVSLAILGMVRATSGDSVEIRLAFAAGAQDFAGPLADPVSCSSTGGFESLVLDAVATRLARTDP